MTAVEEKLLKAKADLLLGQPFFATIVLSQSFIEDNSIKTLATNGTVIKYNTEYVMSLDYEEVRSVLAHEAMHIAMMHHIRRDGRNLKKWNKAADYAINPLLVDSGFRLPEKAMEFVKDEYRNKSTEMIYNLLPEEEEGDGQGEGEGESEEGEGDSDPSGCGTVEDSGTESEAQLAEKEVEVRELVQQAEQAGIKEGSLPAFMQRLIDEILNPAVDWKEVLARFLIDIARNDYSFKRPNPRYAQSGFYLPFLQNEEIGEIILFVDTSGSINRELLNKFGNEMQSIANTFGKGFTVVYIDTKVAGFEEIEVDGPVDLHPSGGGGTDFKPGFEWIDTEERKPRAVVYFTDGVCDSFPEEPDYPVLWALYGTYDFEPPFGEVVKVDE